MVVLMVTTRVPDSENGAAQAIEAMSLETILASQRGPLARASGCGRNACASGRRSLSTAVTVDLDELRWRHSRCESSCPNRAATD